MIVEVTKDNLTFVGSGNASTIIGPTEMYLPPGVSPEPQAIITKGLFSAKFVDIGIENTRNGIHWPYGLLEVERCRFHGCKDGLYLYNEGGARIVDSEFYSDESLAIGIVNYSQGGPITVVGSSFGGPGINEKGVALLSANGNMIDNCDFSMRNAIIFVGSSGTVKNCSASEVVNQAVWATSAAQVVLTDNILHGNFASIYIDSSSQVTGTGNIFTGGQEVATIYASTGGVLNLSGNHILKSGRLAVKLDAFSLAMYEQTLANNWWGTTDTDSIASWIKDMNDDPAIHSVVNFLPIATGLVPTEPTSLGSVKSMFR